MPVDTRSKRESSTQMILFCLNSPVTPDGTIDQGDRQHSTHVYSGILAGGPPAAPTEKPTPRGRLPGRGKRFSSRYRRQL